MPLILPFNYYYVETFTVTFIQHCYDFRIKTMFGSFLPPVICRTDHVLFVFLYAYWCPTYIVLCFCFVCLRLMYLMLPVSLDCSFLIVTSVFTNVYSYQTATRRSHYVII